MENIARGKKVVEKQCLYRDSSMCVVCPDKIGCGPSTEKWKDCPSGKNCTLCGTFNKGATLLPTDEKYVCDKCFMPENLTDGNSAKYTEFYGFCSVQPPGYITLDLERSQPIGTIQFLLWDNRGETRHEECGRKHKYRLLISEDLKRWKVIYDTLRDGYNGWQVFNLHDLPTARYIRLHCISTTEKSPFMVVQMEAYPQVLPENHNSNYRFPVTLFADIGEKYEERGPGKDKNRMDNEITRRRLSGFLEEIINQLSSKRVRAEEHGEYNRVRYFDHLVGELSAARDNTQRYESQVNKIKKKLHTKTEKNIKSSIRANRLAYVAIIVSIIGIAFTIIMRFY